MQIYSIDISYHTLQIPTLQQLLTVKHTKLTLLKNWLKNVLLQSLNQRSSFQRIINGLSVFLMVWFKKTMMLKLLWRSNVLTNVEMNHLNHSWMMTTSAWSSVMMESGSWRRIMITTIKCRGCWTWWRWRSATSQSGHLHSSTGNSSSEICKASQLLPSKLVFQTTILKLFFNLRKLNSSCSFV